jgi:hypothetical protein
MSTCRRGKRGKNWRDDAVGQVRQRKTVPATRKPATLRVEVVGVFAVLYPTNVRQVPFSDLISRLGTSTLRSATSSEGVHRLLTSV